MIATVLMVSLRRLLHNRIELLLTFIVPIAFFSIFALIFGGGVGTSVTPKIKVVSIDEVQTDESREAIRQLREIAGLRFINSHDSSSVTHSPSSISHGSAGSEVIHDADAGRNQHSIVSAPIRGQRRLSVSEAKDMVQRGQVSIAIVIRKESESRSLTADLLSDTSDQVAPQIVAAFVQRALLSSLSASRSATLAQTARSASNEAQSSQAQLSQAQLSQAQQSQAQLSQAQLSQAQAAQAQLVQAHVAQVGGVPQPLNAPDDHGGVLSAPSVRVIDVLGDGKQNPVVSMYAAGIAVMFLLFGATGGGGALLEERENQTLDRLLTTGLSMDELLLGKWFYLTLLGLVQTTVMFIWGQVVFGIDLMGHLDGFLIMTIVTAGAAAAFGLLLATLCKTRGQLNGLSVVLVLTMSALGGSMVPRYVMSQSLRDAGLWTFNAWALEGYEKVFWRDLHAIELWPQMAVLMTCGVAFLMSARVLALRWEAD